MLDWPRPSSRTALTEKRRPFWGPGDPLILTPLPRSVIGLPRSLLRGNGVDMVRNRDGTPFPHSRVQDFPHPPLEQDMQHHDLDRLLACPHAFLPSASSTFLSSASRAPFRLDLAPSSDVNPVGAVVKASSAASHICGRREEMQRKKTLGPRIVNVA